MTDAQALQRAAELLESLAEDIWDSHQIDDEWIDGCDNLKQQYNELYAVAEHLRGIVKP